MELTNALQAARELGVPMFIEVGDIRIGERTHTQVLARTPI